MTNSKTTKRALLSSTLALLICVAMLIGTTFAWFTDTAKTGVNTIKSGNLDVSLEMYENGKWVNAEGKTINFIAKDGNTNILWEPGCTYELPTLRVVNNGNLALKYQVVISGINGDAKLNEAIEWSSAAMFANGSFSSPARMESNVLMNGVMYPDEEANASDWMAASGTFKIYGHMKEDAGNEYQGLSIEGIAITVTATQAVKENDSYGNQYDAGAQLPSVWNGKTFEEPEITDGVYHITNAAEFAAYINAVGGANVSEYTTAKAVLDCDIDLADNTITRTGVAYIFAGQFDGQGHTVSNFTIERTDDALYTSLFGYLGSTNGCTASVKNLTVENATVKGAAQTATIASGVYEGASVVNCHAVNCTVVGEKKVAAVVGYNEHSIVNDCTATDCNIYASDERANQAGAVLAYNAGTSNVTAADAVRVNVYTNAVTVFTAEELAAKLPAGGNIYLMNDIDLKNEPWTPVFMNYGTFDGQGHTIKNLKVEADACPDMGNGYGAALIYWSNGSIINLNVDGADIEGYHNGGAIAGWVNGYAAKIENCHVKNATITINHKNGDLCGDKAGAVAGRVAINVPSVNCTAENCTVKGCRDVGQVFGAATVSVSTGCSATNVTATVVEDSICDDGSAGANIGGIIGRDLR